MWKEIYIPMWTFFSKHVSILFCVSSRVKEPHKWFQNTKKYAAFILPPVLITVSSFLLTSWHWTIYLTVTFAEDTRRKKHSFACKVMLFQDRDTATLTPPTPCTSIEALTLPLTTQRPQIQLHETPKIYKTNNNSAMLEVEYYCLKTKPCKWCF